MVLLLRYARQGVVFMSLGCSVPMTKADIRKIYETIFPA